ncbi:MAG: 6-hydroxymethylpterin diphosphokinase MptE-like protein [Waddliaceae bacterium]
MNEIVSEEIFEENREKWAPLHPKAGVWLSFLECDRVCFSKSENRSLNLADRQTQQCFHSTKDPEGEAGKWFDELDLVDARLLYVYGVGLGYAYEAAKEWLEADARRSLIFLEDDLEVISQLFRTANGGKILNDPQVYLYFFQGDVKEGEIYNHFFWDFFKSKYVISCLGYYKKIKRKEFEGLKETIDINYLSYKRQIEDYLNLGKDFFPNFYANLLKLPDSYSGNSLFGKFKGIPAIISGAGPSLEKHLDVLKTVGKKALLLAGGSAVTALTTAGVRPHFGLSIDPYPSQYERFARCPKLDFPFFYRHRVHFRALELLQGPRLYVKGSIGYYTAKWFDLRLGIAGEEIEEGHSVLNFALEIARSLGCNPIILVGVDFAFTRMQTYASGVENDVRISKEALLSQETHGEKMIEKKDRDGQSIYTLGKWILEANWIGDFAKKHTELTLINATEGGLNIPDVANMRFKDVEEKFLQRPLDLQALIQSEIDKAQMPPVTLEKVKRELKNFKCSFERCQDYFRLINEENQVLINQLERGENIEAVQTSERTLYESELFEEPAYRYSLSNFDSVASIPFTQDFKNRLSKEEKSIRMLKLYGKRMDFLSRAALANIDWINQSLRRH